ncbi:MAG: transcriptional regulator [Oscillospiraceae bacterium]
MATNQDYIEYICEQIADSYDVTYRKMFGEYMIYINSKPLLTVCDNIVYVKILDCIKDLMIDAEVGEPYKGAKPHYILDVENREFAKQVIMVLEENTKPPKPKTKKQK